MFTLWNITFNKYDREAFTAALQGQPDPETPDIKGKVHRMWRMP